METTQIHGYVERITYYNDETGFIVARIQEKGKSGLTTIIGNLAGINAGEYLRASGKWVTDNRFGEQFRVDKFETVVPATVKGIEKYLGSGLIKGIGPVMARRIVKVFGADTLDIIEKEPGLLSRVEGIGPGRIGIIKKAWEEQREIKEIMVFLQGHGVSAAYSARIFKHYGKDSIETVKNNPYRLAADVYGIGFVTADNIARNMGIDPNSEMRAVEGIIYVLNQLMGEGHVYYPYQALVDSAAEMLKVERDVVVRAMARLYEDRRIIIEDLNLPGEDFRPNNKAVYLAPFYHAETELAARLLELSGERPAAVPDRPESLVEEVEKRLAITLAAKQREAVLSAITGKVTVITGGPGTGKTTIIKAIISIYREMGQRLILGAPTGRAAKRMQEATGHEAKTIHRLLEYSHHSGGFQRDRKSPLEADVVIIDEMSMVDIILMYHLIKAVPDHAAVILVGDINQLPSVGPGAVFRNIIESGRFSVVNLTEIFRQARNSRIIVNAHLINMGKFPEISSSPDGVTDFYFVPEDSPGRALEKILTLCGERIPGRFGYDPVKDIQVLTPMHRGEVGVSSLNMKLQELLNPGGAEVARGYKTFREGDKVMQVVNNYDREVFNGDIGWILSINREDQEVVVDFEGRSVSYGFSDLDELILAYAVSIHKSQGSEYPVVVMPVMTQHYMMLQRNLIYTGITRGKKLVVIVGSKKAMAIAVRNNKTENRYTRLGERLMAGRVYPSSRLF
ncbi:MAG: ATP-dependent RecD-like DNA helicase [Bacillota bacterium]